MLQASNRGPVGWRADHGRDRQHAARPLQRRHHGCGNSPAPLQHDPFVVAAAVVQRSSTGPGNLTTSLCTQGGVCTAACHPGIRLSVSPAGVPFVDVLTTMLDETIPLTTIEFEEWCASMLRPFCLAVPLEQHGSRCTMPKAPMATAF